MEWADSRGIRQLLEFIGGFEKWSILNEDCRQEITKYLDYPSRCRLERCSKQDYQTVQNTPIEIEKLEIEEHEQFVTVRVRFDGGYRDDLPELKFSQSGEDTTINWDKPSDSFYPHKDIGESEKEAKKVCNACKCCAIWNKEKRKFPNLVVRSSNYYEEAVKFVEGWMKKPCYRVTGFEVNALSYPFDRSQIEMLSNCKKVWLGVSSMEDVRWWMERLPEKMEFLGLKNLSDKESMSWMTSEVLQIQKIAQAEKVIFENCTDFSTDALLDCEFHKFSFYSEFNTNPIDQQAKRINKFIKNMVEEDGVKGFRELRLYCKTRSLNVKVLLDGLKYQEWEEVPNLDADFESFVNGIHGKRRDRTIYHIPCVIDPSENITIIDDLEGFIDIIVNYDRHFKDFDMDWY